MHVSYFPFPAEETTVNVQFTFGHKSLGVFIFDNIFTFEFDLR